MTWINKSVFLRSSSLVETHSLFYFTFTETLQDAIFPILQILKLKLKEAKCPSFLCSFLL